MGSKPTAAHRPRHRLLTRFGTAAEGAVAVEFALVAIPFFAMLFAILQTALVFFAGQVFQTAVSDSARLIMTGQAQAQKFDQAGFKQQICNRLLSVFNCDGVSVDVSVAATLGSATPAPIPIKKDKVDTSGFGYNAGNGCNIVTVRAVYVWPLFVTPVDLGLKDVGNGHMLVATAVFRNEPFGSEAACAS
jgi:Flp pilus assembly protein TadG